MHGQGPLVPFAEGLSRELRVQGHPRSSVEHYIDLMGQLDRWLITESLGAGDVTAEVAQRFLDERRRGGHNRVPTLAALSPLFEYLRTQGVLTPSEASPATPQEKLVERYHRHLVNDRGLAPTTVHRYELFARRFLAWRMSSSGTQTGVENLSITEVHTFMLESSARLAVESAKREAADLHALLRFLYIDGVLATDLAGAMPPVASWRGTRLPSTMQPGDVDLLLASCDRATASGRRDYAILMLLARLGLRSAEVAGLELRDIDWRCGVITVRGKARRTDRLPLPAEVGEALVAYLKDGRPPCRCPKAIVTLYAPPQPLHPSSITSVVYHTCRRAGIHRVGAHRLRHALATEMLRCGADLPEIAQVLRHSDLGTTSVYAKVDRVALRGVAQAWPGTSR